MMIVRSTTGILLFLAVIFAIRWGGNALVQKAIRQAKDTKYTWGNDLPKPAFDWQDPKFQLQPGWQDGMLYHAKDDDSGPKYRVR